MNEAWKTLTGAGLPDGAPREMPSSIDLAAARRALASVDPEGLDEIQRVVLLAWIEAFRHHWPSRFERELGDNMDLVRELRRRAVDANRYLKLRRIAAENLARML